MSYITDGMQVTSL